ncbi:MAG: hypothetical protein EZS28_035790, partial [Streblomastix strix]
MITRTQGSLNQTQVCYFKYSTDWRQINLFPLEMERDQFRSVDSTGCPSNME